MANELQATAGVNFTKGFASLGSQANATVTVAGTKYCDLVQNIGTADEVIVFGDIGTPGYYMIQNLDSTNYVDIGFDGATYQIRLAAGSSSGAGGVMIAPNNGATIHAKANTAACDVTIRAIAP